jgi:UDP-GlcNAc3NAcA epimerase
VRVLTIVGNRPQFVKAAAVSRLLREEHEEVLVHTGQHHDDELSRVFFDELGVPAPDHQLGVHDGSNTSQTARMLAGLEPLIADAAADAVLVYGDTNSTLAGALAAVQGGVPVAHVEAGMRSFDRTMPEEVNRVLVDHVSALLLVPTDAAVENLRREGAVGEVVRVGDVMADVSLLVQPRVRDSTAALAAHDVDPGDYLLLTAHRPGNVDDPEQLARLVDLVLALPGPVVFPVHPRTRARLEAAGSLDRLATAPGVRLTAPLGYLEFTELLVHARAVLTDSGGLQKEAYLAGVPCVTLRTTTEWVETIEAGWNAIVGLDAAAALAALERRPPAERPELYGGGRAGARVVEALDALARS